MTLPVIDELRALKTHGERAAWLNRCPDVIVIGYLGGLHAVLDDCGFAAGSQFVSARAAALSANRSAEGLLPYTVGLTVEAARGLMKEAAKGETECGE